MYPLIPGMLAPTHPSPHTHTSINPPRLPKVKTNMAYMSTLNAKFTAPVARTGDPDEGLMGHGMVTMELL